MVAPLLTEVARLGAPEDTVERHRFRYSLELGGFRLHERHPTSNREATDR